MQSDGEWIQSYNCQAAVDGDHQVIVAIGVSNQPPSVEHLNSMLARPIANTGQVLKTFIPDAGYLSEANSRNCAAQGADPHIATGRQKHGQPTPRLLDRSQWIRMRKEKWPANCATMKDGRSTPGGRRLSSSFLAKLKNAAVCGPSRCADWRR